MQSLAFSRLIIALSVTAVKLSENKLAFTETKVGTGNRDRVQGVFLFFFFFGSAK